ncbi:glycosyltransferase family A protein [Streptomyces sp. PKU-EA00015]|uniref:glycosyltransferase family 2 protein n=1 Tax=Streptomyces sp. PKU-EA00015 TaxID=2748326 RepID=UPI002810EFDF|nr:glycosyltransferase family A protein [Streptomyces sp. PKU-EA00015]
MRLWVVVPAYNEAPGITATLRALAAQTDRDFSLVVVDNDSTDGTADVVRSCGFPGDLHVVHETRKGTGAAADTGMRYAIAHGATHLARTDADCLPEPDWTARVRAAFGDGLQLIAGRLRPRTDEAPLPPLRRGAARPSSEPPKRPRSSDGSGPATGGPATSAPM